MIKEKEQTFFLHPGLLVTVQKPAFLWAPEFVADERL